MSHRTRLIIRRIAQAILIVLLLLAGWLGWQAYVVYRGVSEITGKVVARPTGQPAPVLPPFGGNRRVNFLLLGSDTDQKKEEAAPLTQSMIVVTVDPVRKRVDMLSIPRDFYVPVPGHGLNKIDLAFKYGYQKGGMSGGVELARDTVEKLFHIEIDYYGWVGLQGFAKVVDTFGGVNLEVQHPVLDDTYPNDIHSPDPYGERRLFIPAGWQHMDGPSALEYVRSRHGDIHSDFGRSQRQQQLLLEMRQKVNASNIIMRLSDLVSDLENSVQTDLTLQQLYQLDQLSHTIHQPIHRVVLQAPTYCTYSFSADGQSILQPRWDKIMPVVRQMFAPIPTPAPVPTSTPTPKPTRGPTVTPGPQPSPVPTRRPTAPPTPTPAPPAVERLPATLLYVSDGDIYETDRSGTTTRLTYSHDAAMPRLSPDGKTLAFVRFTIGLHKYDKYASDIWLMDLATRRQHVITSDENSVAANNLWAAWPIWSPDGHTIVFASDRNKLGERIWDFRKIDLGIWSMPARGGKPVPLTTPRKGAGGDTDPIWRPHTRQFLYVSWAYPSDASQNPSSQLMLHGATGNVALTPLSGRVLQPSWSPDGRTITFIRSSAAAGTDELVVAAVAGTAARPTLKNVRVLARGHLAQPSFTPDGKNISFIQAGLTDVSLYLIPASGGAPREVTAIDAQIDARWRPVWVR